MIPKDQGEGGTHDQKVNQPFPSQVVQNKSVDEWRATSQYHKITIEDDGNKE